MPQEIIFKESQRNVKSKKRPRNIRYFKEKDAEREFNQNLKKAFWRHENPRQQLWDFQRQIVIYANLFMNHRKKQQKQIIAEQRARIDGYCYH